MSQLNDQLNQIHKQDLEKNQQVTQLLDNFFQSLNVSKVLKEGNNIPDFQLVDLNGQKVSIKNFLGQGPLVLAFYRGGWCHYCSKELQVLQQYNSQINKLGGQIIGISHQLKDFAVKTKNDNGLQFNLLVDENAEFANQLGIVFDMPQNIYDALNTFTNLQQSYGEGGARKIVIPATFIVDTNGKIIRSFVSNDYTKRMEPSEIADVLKTCSKVESS